MKNKKNNSPQQSSPGEESTDITIYMSALQAAYQPAADARHATHWFTTAEVVDAIRQIDPAAIISKEQIFRAMLQAGFKFQPRPGTSGCEFRWMLQLKNQ